jgi:G6PDH family F420-dependent oxidoreductase
VPIDRRIASVDIGYVAAMTEFGYFLSSEEHGPGTLLEQAQQAEAAGFESVWISDHFHPWLDEQGQSPFVWGVIGAIGATTSLQVTTAVTCPTIRIHPAIVAQAAATSSLLTGGRFRLGVGTGEALNEHVLGDRWPSTDERLSMLAEAVAIMRELWTGEQVSFDGDHYVVDRARLYSAPETTIEVPVSAFGPKAATSVAEYADAFVTTTPADDVVKTYREHGGKGPVMAGLKVCWGSDEKESVDLAHRLWRNSVVPGELAQELAMPAHFDQAAQLVSTDDVAEQFACGPDPERHVAAIKPYLEAGVDELYINQIGSDQAGFFDFFRKEIEPRL